MTRREIMVLWIRVAGVLVVNYRTPYVLKTILADLMQETREKKLSGLAAKVFDLSNCHKQFYLLNLEKEQGGSSIGKSGARFGILKS